MLGICVLSAAGFVASPPHAFVARSPTASIRMEAVAPESGATASKPWWRRMGGSEEKANSEARLATVAEYMTAKEKLITLTPGTSLQDAACTLCEAGVTGAPVVGDPCPRTGAPLLVGMLSQTDLLHKAAGKFHVPFVTSGARSERYTKNTERLRKALAGDVGDAMSTHPVTITKDVTMQKAAAKLLRQKINRLAVVDEDGGLIGLISTTDIMRAVTTDPAGCAILDN